ncbi:hypothetical protein EJB05_03020 [Eragrostis curvula]|uniref:Uncharacterized protein n=1 Tax=Eragrostis curvula TaxID=38414 RepID=A0A5J9WU33_9POAL|nr:hypothetical protein EJB05_03020 [Eragrostis curvula]
MVPQDKLHPISPGAEKEKLSQIKNEEESLMDAIPGQPEQSVDLKVKIVPEETMDDFTAASGSLSSHGMMLVPCRLGGVPQSELVYEVHGEPIFLAPNLAASAIWNAPVQIKPVWSDELKAATNQIEKIVKEGSKMTAFIDTEFCRLLPSSWTGEPNSPDGHYLQTRETVNGGNLVQFGILLTDSSSQQVLGDALEFNLKFDASTRPANDRTVEFLRSHLNLDDHAIRGIEVHNFASFLMCSGLMSNANVTWVTFQAYNDYGYVVKCLEGTEALPEDREDFLSLAAAYFPNSYDLKVFHRLGICCTQASKGNDSLDDLATGLSVQRDGESHTAGSDAVVTMRCFYQMMLRDPPAFRPIRRYKNMLHGVMNPELSASYVRASDSHSRTVHVWCANFPDQMKVICSLFPLVGVIAVEATLQESDGSAEMAVAISDGWGWLAYDKVWVFHLHGQKENAGGGAQGKMSRVMLAELLTRAQAIMSESVRWVSSSSRTFVYLVDAVTAAPAPAEDEMMFKKLRKAFFGNVAIQPPAEPELVGASSERRAVATLRRFLQGGREDADKA